MPRKVVAGKERPLTCEIEGGELVVRIGISVLAFAAQNIQTLFDHEEELKVCDEMEFAKDVCRALGSEEEDGSSLLTDVLDKASVVAWEDGSIGCHE